MASASGNFKDRYKEKGLWFGDHVGKRILRADKINAERKDRRRNAFSIQRELSSPLSDSAGNKASPPVTQEKKPATRQEALRQWKKQREAKLRMLKNAQKPVFKVGVVKHKVYSPACCCDKENCKANACSETKVKGKKGDQVGSCATPSYPTKPFQLSSSMKKRNPPSAVMSGRVAGFLRQRIENANKPLIKAAAQPLGKLVEADVKVFGGSVDEERTGDAPADGSVADAESGVQVPEERADPSTVAAAAAGVTGSTAATTTTTTTRPEAVPESADGVQQQEEKGDSVSDCEDFPAMHSPYVTVTRGKNRRSDVARKGYDSPRIFSSASTSSLQRLSNMLSEMQGEEDQRGVKYFRLKLYMEQAVLQCLCSYWSASGALCEQQGQDWQETADSAVGQCKLLLSKKMAQFAALIEDCEGQRGERPVTVDDLQGFWDVMHMQVIDVRKRFHILEEQYLNGGQALDASKQRRTRKTSKDKKVAANSKPKVEVKSSMRAMIAAARKRQKEAVSGSAASEDAVVEEQAVLVSATSSAGRTPRRRGGASLHRQVLEESFRKTVTWDTTPDLSTSTSKQEQVQQPSPVDLGVPSRRVTRSSVATPRSALKNSSLPAPQQVAASGPPQHPKTPRKIHFAEDMMSFQTPVEEPVTVRRSKRIGSTGVK